MRSIAIILLLTAISSCKFSEAPSAGLSKEMCSCLFVAEQTEEYCRLVTKESRILAKWEANYTEKKITATGMNYISVAALDEDSRFGCSIESVELDPNGDDKHLARNER